MRNKTLTRIIIATLMCAFLTFYVGEATRAYALAVGPLADPIYDTDVIALKDYVEYNLDAPQLDIMFFLMGGLAVAQMGAQDAMLISPYPNEETVKEWLINCGIQLYNSVIGLVPEGDYYMDIPSIGTGGTKGIPRQTIKALVASMMGDAVVAANYPTLDDFLEENPDEFYLPITPDLQLGLNAVYGLHGGLTNWQLSTGEFKSNTFEWYAPTLTGSQLNQYNNYVSQYLTPPNYVFANTYNNQRSNCISSIDEKYNLFLNGSNMTAYIVDDEGHNLNGLGGHTIVFANNGHPTYKSLGFSVTSRSFSSVASYNAPDIVQYILDGWESNYMINALDTSNYVSFFWNIANFIDHYYYGTSWDNRVEVFHNTNLNIADAVLPYYEQLQDRHLLNIISLIEDLVNTTNLRQPVYTNYPELPDVIQVSVDLTPITDLLAPPLPVNMNDIALYTDNDYLREIRDRSEKFGEAIGEYFVFWHNSDPVTVYVIFGSVIVVLIGAFIGKWGHS